MLGIKNVKKIKYWNYNTWYRSFNGTEQNSARKQIAALEDSQAYRGSGYKQTGSWVADRT